MPSNITLPDPIPAKDDICEQHCINWINTFNPTLVFLPVFDVKFVEMILALFGSLEGYSFGKFVPISMTYKVKIAGKVVFTLSEKGIITDGECSVQ
jgi:hypothetical protein